MDSLVHVDVLQEITDALIGLLEGLIVVEIDLLFFEGTNEPLGKAFSVGRPLAAKRIWICWPWSRLT